MSGWKAKRFWKEARAEACEGGFTVRLDGRPVKTPAKVALVVPTLAMAEAIAAEWDAQTGEVKPDTMPVTRAANSAIDKIVPQRAAVVEIVAAYGGSDLLCYRAVGPAELIARQAAGWDPLLDWAADALGVRLAVTTGVMHVEQDAAALARDPETAWSLSRVDEDWQIEEWGEDEEAAELAAVKRADFLQAARFYGLCG